MVSVISWDRHARLTMRKERIHNKCDGFTVLEMVTSLLIMGVIIGTTVPQFSAFTASFERRIALDIFSSDLRRMRSEAISSGMRACLKFNVNATAYDVGIDYLPYNPTLGPDTILYSRSLPRGFRVTGAQEIILDSRGFVIGTDGISTSHTLNLVDGQITFAIATISPIGIVRGVQ